MRIVNHDIYTWVAHELEKVGFRNIMKNAWIKDSWTVLIGAHFLHAEGGNLDDFYHFHLSRSNSDLLRFFRNRAHESQQFLRVGRSPGPTRYTFPQVVRRVLRIQGKI